MREIKFRGYSKTDKKWVYGNLIEKDGFFWILEKAIGCYSQNRKSGIYDCLGGRFRFELHKIEEKSLGQFTGLKDKNGREIYEGDVVKCIVSGNTVVLYEVIWLDIFANFALRDERREESYRMSIFNEYEIIGNIFENKELLKKKRQKTS